MFLDLAIRRNPKLIVAATRLHQAGEIPANSYLIDLETVKENAQIIRDEADRLGLCLYGMTKQFGRNPIVCDALKASGIDKMVAVDIQCLEALARTDGIRVGHAGHLVQIPRASVRRVVEMRPEVMTVFSMEKAQEIGEAARRLDIEQELLVRVYAPGDTFYPGHEGGIPEDEVVDAVRAMNKIHGVRVVGVTSFPCFLLNSQSRTVEQTPNMSTIVHAARDLARQLGIRIKQVNAPGTTSSATLEYLARQGGTHAEPGHGLTGTTPYHVFRDLPERPAVIYVSEISHFHGGKAFFFGGGLYIDKVLGDYQAYGLVGSEAGDLLGRKLPIELMPAGSIDYYGTIQGGKEAGIRIGDTVVMGFRIQSFVTRGRIAVVDGVQSGNTRLMGIFGQCGERIVR